MVARTVRPLVNGFVQNEGEQCASHSHHNDSCNQHKLWVSQIEPFSLAEHSDAADAWNERNRKLSKLPDESSVANAVCRQILTRENEDVGAGQTAEHLNDDANV